MLLAEEMCACRCATSLQGTPASERASTASSPFATSAPTWLATLAPVHPFWQAHSTASTAK